MEELIVFLSNYGLYITLIAIVGIAVLGVMKYCNLFKKIDETKRHYIYLLISVGFSVVATAIYLAIIRGFEWDYFLAISVAMFALNQTFYSIFKVTPINKLFVTILDLIKNHFIKDSKNTVEVDVDIELEVTAEDTDKL